MKNKIAIIFLIKLLLLIPINKSKENHQLIDSRLIKIFGPPLCGKSILMENSTGVVAETELPWIVMILGENAANSKRLFSLLCCGTIIHPSVVLTTASCIRGKSADKLVLRAGEYNAENKNEKHLEQNQKAIEVKIHEKFVHSTLLNDIALIILESPFYLAKNVQPICLGTSKQSKNDYASEHCFTGGWYSDKKDRKDSKKLKKERLTILDRIECEKKLQSEKFDDESKLCALPKNKCKGSLGSPLFCKINGNVNQYKQVGILNWGFSCNSSIPATFVNLHNYQEWVNKIMDDQKFNKTYYVSS